MKVKLVSKSNTEVGEKELPRQFLEPVRPDIIQKAVRAVQMNKRQSYGAKKGAGMRHSADLSKKRRDFRGSYGWGISRVPRKILSARGTRFNWEGAVIPGTVGGRRAHPPKAEKKWSIKINKKERQKAIRSALAAAVSRDVVEMRGHNPPDNYPFVVQEDFEDIERTQDLRDALKKLGFEEELERTREPQKKSGKAKRRGRGKKYKTGLLIIVGDEDSKVRKAANNIPGVETAYVKHLNAETLAPGSHPGRITLFTETAVDILEGQGMFTDEDAPEAEE